MAAERGRVRIMQNGDAVWDYPLAVSRDLGWTRGIEVVRGDSRRVHDE